MTRDLFANTATTTLAASSTAGTFSLSVYSSAQFPAASSPSGTQFRVRVGSELFIVTNVSGTTWTVTPGAEGTTQAAHSAGDTVTHVVTAGFLGTLPQTADTYFEGAAGTFTTTAGTFTVLPITSVYSASGVQWSDATHFYTVPSDGVYSVSATIRPNDSQGYGVQYGLGIHTATGDGQWFLWNATPPSPSTRSSYPYARLGRYTAGQQLRAFTYTDSALNFTSAGLWIARVG